VQLTPPGSAFSIIFVSGITSAAPGSADGVQLVVTDLEAARAELVGHGVEVSEVFHDAGGVFHHAGWTATLLWRRPPTTCSPESQRRQARHCAATVSSWSSARR
jgi:hypothetical protein